MADNKSKFYNDENMQIEPYYGPSSTARPNDLRSYNTSYASSFSATSYSYTAEPSVVEPPQKRKKGKSFGDAEFQRRKRVASYKAYSMEGQIKGSFRKSFRWLKDRYTKVVHGWW